MVAGAAVAELVVLELDVDRNASSLSQILPLSSFQALSPVFRSRRSSRPPIHSCTSQPWTLFHPTSTMRLMEAAVSRFCRWTRVYGTSSPLGHVYRGFYGRILFDFSTTHTVGVFPTDYVFRKLEYGFTTEKTFSEILIQWVLRFHFFTTHTAA